MKPRLKLTRKGWYRHWLSYLRSYGGGVAEWWVGPFATAEEALHVTLP